MSPPPSRVLLVDDSATCLQATRETLESHGFEVVTEQTPFDAFRAIKEHRPSLVLVDMEMPGIDGAAFVKVARACIPKAMLRVAFYSSCPDRVLEEAVHATHAVGYARKSDSPMDLVDRVRRWVSGAGHREET